MAKDSGYPKQSSDHRPSLSRLQPGTEVVTVLVHYSNQPYDNTDEHFEWQNLLLLVRQQVGGSSMMI